MSKFPDQEKRRYDIDGGRSLLWHDYQLNFSPEVMARLRLLAQRLKDHPEEFADVSEDLAESEDDLRQ